MKFFVQQDVLDAGVKVLFVTMHGIDNTTVPEQWRVCRTQRLHRLCQEYQELDVHADPVLEGFHILHDVTGVKRRKNIPASENLIKLLKKNQGEMYLINTAVDIYNLLSMESKLALGAHNIDRVDGNVTLRFTDGTERFVPLGQSEPIPVAPHEYCYCDDSNEVLCRLEIRQVNKTAVDETAQNVLYIIQGNRATPDELLWNTARQLIDETQTFCGGSGEIVEAEIV